MNQSLQVGDTVHAIVEGRMLTTQVLEIEWRGPYEYSLVRLDTSLSPMLDPPPLWVSERDCRRA